MDNEAQSFHWSDIGDIGKGRPTLGPQMHAAVYRMFHFSFRSVLEKTYGKEAVNGMLLEAGRLAGMEFCRNMLDVGLPPEPFFGLLGRKLEEMGVGILQVEHADFDNMIFILTVSEDLDCSGLPVTGETVCHFDEGFITGILESYTQRQYLVRETDCWSTGDGICRFHVVAI
jgi:predicted hydrocarbon binding protein